MDSCTDSDRWIRCEPHLYQRIGPYKAHFIDFGAILSDIEHPSGACSGPIIIFNTNCPMAMHNQIFENVWPLSLDSKNRLQNLQDMVESTIQRCFEITHFRRKIQQILEFQKVENQTVQLEIKDANTASKYSAIF